ncbi:winged helix-turn-helix domain-containing protein [Streptomyces caniscabiei]|uniref:helix-turn-helix domain-containing protein n=1 Tax=Streptomyces caniscabiei TaxID=2746961 RepID=UPI001F24D0BF|nr:winged helix-turn-helix domain-containing protein [Streptomyces sp. AMCC400023]
MRYAQGGGLTHERRAFREKLRLEAAERFQQGDETRTLRTTCESASGQYSVGARGLVSGRAGSPGLEGADVAAALSDELLAVLEPELCKGPVAHGWPDQTWTLSRIKPLVGRRFHRSYTVQGVAALLRRHGWTCQVPARRAIERDEAAVAAG